MVDLRWVTGACQIASGLVAVLVVIITWWMSPHDRVKRYGPYLTAAGFRRFLENLPTGLIFGLFLVLSGASKWAFFLSDDSYRPQTSLALFMGTAEAIFGTAFVAVLIWKMIRSV